MRLRDWLDNACRTLQPLALNNPHAQDLHYEAVRLWADVLDHPPASVMRFHEQQLTAEELSQLNQALARRAAGEPLAHITGRWWFWDLELRVNPSTLIPRPDTELLVDTALHLPLPALTRALDLGTGTGAIALVLANERPAWQVWAVDVEPDAVALAEHNRQQLQLSNVTVQQSHWFDGLTRQSFDLIVSNPPYIDEHEPELLVGDVRFEPRTALVAPEQGLADLRIIIETSRGWLSDHGYLLLEHGYQQAEAVQQLLRQAGFVGVETRADLAGVPRMTLGRWPGIVTPAC